ncbi:MAG TPA: DUF1801 domain-containing protein [Bacteroidales bacterium]
MNKITEKDSLNDFLKNADANQHEIVLKLKDALMESNPEFRFGIKWGQLVFSINNDFHHWICSISLTQKYIGLNFHFGSYLTDHSNAFKTGSSRFLRQLRFTHPNHIQPDIINDFVNQAFLKLDEFKVTWKQK